MFTISLIESLPDREEDSMRDNSYDRTIERNYLQKWRFFFPQNKREEGGKKGVFPRVGGFLHHQRNRHQTDRKQYKRYPHNGDGGEYFAPPPWANRVGREGA